MKKFVLFSLFLLAMGCLNQVDKEKVVAKVGSKVYSVDDINSRIQDLDPQLQEYFQQKENKVRLLNQIVDEEVIYQLAKKQGLQRKKDFKENLDELKRKALINFFILQNVDDMSEVTRVEVEEFYNDNSNQFSAYESRNISHILVESNADAKNVLARLRKGERFADLAKKYSIDPSKDQGGQLGWVRKDQLVPQFADVAYTLTKSSPVSGVVQTQFGYHVILFNDSRVVPEQPLDAVYAQISEQLLVRNKQERFQEILKNGKDTLKVEKTVENL